MQLKRTVKFEADRDPEFARWISHTVGGERIPSLPAMRVVQRQLPTLSLHGLHPATTDAPVARGVKRGSPQQFFDLAVHRLLRVHGRVPEENQYYSPDVCAEGARHPGALLSQTLSHTGHGAAVFAAWSGTRDGSRKAG